MDVRQLQNQISEKQQEGSLSSAIKEMKKEPITEDHKKKAFATRRESFNITYQLDNGSEKKESITSVVLDSTGRQMMNRIIVNLAGGVKIESLPAEEQGRISCLARIATQIEEPSDWLINTCGEDLDFCYYIAERLVDHETRYFRNNSGEGQGGEVKPRFSIDSATP